MHYTPYAIGVTLTFLGYTAFNYIFLSGTATSAVPSALNFPTVGIEKLGVAALAIGFMTWFLIKSEKRADEERRRADDERAIAEEQRRAYVALIERTNTSLEQGLRDKRAAVLSYTETLRALISVYGEAAKINAELLSVLKSQNSMTVLNQVEANPHP